MNLNQRSYQKELLDEAGIPFEDISRNMKELNIINTLLGGHAITLKGFKRLVGNRKRIHICEIGCGGGDNLVAIARYAQKKGITLKITGIDINPNCAIVAASNSKIGAEANWIVSDYEAVVFQEKPDIIFSSLFCHHFKEASLVKQIQWMDQYSSLGFFINDLHRHKLAYYSIKLLTQLFSHSYLVKHDAPLSVARGFRKKEWLNQFADSNVKVSSLSWEWAFRHLIVVQKEAKFL